MTERNLIATCSVCKDKYKHSCVDINVNEVCTLVIDDNWTEIVKNLQDIKFTKIRIDIKKLKEEKYYFEYLSMVKKVKTDNTVSGILVIISLELVNNNFMLFRVSTSHY